jgi:hypothetical protein
VPETPTVPTETTVPEIDTEANGAAISAGIGAVAAALAAIGSTIASTELAKLADPCIRQSILENRLVRMERGLSDMITAVNFFASANQSSVLDAIEGWGENTGNSGGKNFPSWLLESGAITNPPEAFFCYSGPFFAGIGTAGCLISISAGLPSNGTSAPSRTNSGYRVGGGLYRYPGANGTWRGSRFRSEWASWRRHQRANVWNPRSGRPEWRAKLTSWCGAYRSTWEIWRPGDPIAAESTIGRTIVLVNNFRETVELARERCTEAVNVTNQLAFDQNNRLNQMVEDSGFLGKAGLAASTQLESEKNKLEQEKLESEERLITNLTIAGVLGLALVVLSGKK